LKVAILHPWFLTRGGSEKVVDVLAGMYPEADIYTLFLDPEQLSPVLRGRRVIPTMLNRIPFASSKLHRHLMPLYPWAIESLDLRDYDLVISSCGPAMMGAAIREDATHISYCHTPQRSWWDLYPEHQHRQRGVFRHMFTFGATWVRAWEFAAMQRVDHVVSNSNYIAARVHKYFRRESTVIHPPVTVNAQPVSPQRGDYYLTLGRLEKQKRVDLLIQACNTLGRRLLVAGTGKEEAYLKSLAGPTIEFLGYVPDSALPALYGNARAFLFAALEDFGIAPIEAQGYGLPVIAYGRGGSLETVRVNDPLGRPDTGIFFFDQNAAAVVDAI
jgi:glycosyltransferase involved in cell wall biosynthesis